MIIQDTSPEKIATADGRALHAQIEALYPIMRSITGAGVVQTLEMLQQQVPLTIHNVACGESVLDWHVPDEWVFNEGYIADETGRRLVDSANSTLHVVNYSIGVNQTLTLDELQPHLHSLPEQPDAIPYRTCYYDKNWGFCLTENQRKALGPGPFHVVIDAEHIQGNLSFGELLIPGESDDEFLVSTHICHPSLANDNLSGLVLSAALANYVSSQRESQRSTDRKNNLATLPQQLNHLTWRFVFVPGTIGAISWLDRHRDTVGNIKAGLVLTGLGDEHPFTWKEPRTGNSWIDQLVRQALTTTHPDKHQVIPFGPYGYDERQYCSPGFNLPVGRLTRGVHGTFPEYHTSLDNLDFVKPERLEESLELLQALADAANTDYCYQNLQPYGEPQLGRRGLYGSVGALQSPGDAQMAMLWLLNQSDGETPLSTIAQMSGLPQSYLSEIAALLCEKQLLSCGQHILSAGS